MLLELDLSQSCMDSGITLIFVLSALFYPILTCLYHTVWNKDYSLGEKRAQKTLAFNTIPKYYDCVYRAFNVLWLCMLY